MKYGAALIHRGVSVAPIVDYLLPGAHVALFGGTDAAIEARCAGLHFRDTLLVLKPGPSYELVPVFRKPLSETTVVDQVLKSSTGPVNIDACRVGTSTRTNASSARKPRSTMNKGMAQGTVTQKHAYGRWPSNLVLLHAPGCVPGYARMNGHKGYPNGPGGSSAQFSQKGRQTTRTGAWAGHADADGKETVPAWECVERCSVRLLDEQRYFPQFGGMPDFLVWLQDLLLPPGTLLFR